MRRSVTVSLPSELGRMLDTTSRRRGTTRSLVIQEALRRYFAQMEYERLRSAMLPIAERLEIFSDADVFERVS